MALTKKLAKRDNSDNENTVKNETKLQKRDVAAKLAKTDKKQVAVKRDRANRLEETKKYFRGVLNELKKVHWPNRREIMLYTAVTLVAVTLVGILIWVFDSLLSWVLPLIVK